MQQRLVAEQRWMLGSTTRMAPAEVMAEIFRVLRHMNVRWKKLGPYNLKCLYRLAAVALEKGDDTTQLSLDDNNGDGDGDAAMDDDGADEPSSVAVVNDDASSPSAETPMTKDVRVKFEIQVYKMKDERYMIDFQRMDGGVMTCMDAAAAMTKNLRFS